MFVRSSMLVPLAEPAPSRLPRFDHLTFRGNLKETRYGWLRLTPAYSVHLVAELLDGAWSAGDVVLDPFCGTGTTALVCAERGIACDTTDINPFLLWLARAKSTPYAPGHVDAFRAQAARVGKAMRGEGTLAWTPSLHQIEKWWDPPALHALARAMRAIRRHERDVPREVTDLLLLAFCRVMIDRAHVSFGHQSMSFRKKAASEVPEAEAAVSAWDRAVEGIGAAAGSLIATPASPIHCDARDLRKALPSSRYGVVITSPPYPNRMSYIRELRPYMYWLGYLSDGRQAGELDWKAIGGTWGCATSNVSKWKPASPVTVPYEGFEDIVRKIRAKSDVLGPYVAKYFHDMTAHCASLAAVVAPAGTVHYIVGNSKFYDVMLPVERIYAAMFEAAGFVDARVRTIRKRTSKKELFEFVVSARKPKKGKR
ncbi:MAG TPA: DNA methyltransferase [Polyangiaceae bacterium]